jgi:hypothetical protein
MHGIDRKEVSTMSDSSTSELLRRAMRFRAPQAVGVGVYCELGSSIKPWTAVVHTEERAFLGEKAETMSDALENAFEKLKERGVIGAFSFRKS